MVPFLVMVPFRRIPLKQTLFAIEVSDEAKTLVRRAISAGLGTRSSITSGMALGQSRRAVLESVQTFFSSRRRHRSPGGVDPVEIKERPGAD